MSRRELEKYSLLSQVLAKQLSQVRAAQLLGLSDRHVRNLLQAIKREGAKGLVSKKRGRPSNRSIDPVFKAQVMRLIKERYSDFGPTFAAEKLSEIHKIKVSPETLRKWMIQEKLWISKKARPILHPSRPRRDCFGEMIQIDASTHAWFEERASKCALIVFIDDATSRITSAFFCQAECLDGYFAGLRKHLLKYGRPRSLYSDRHAIFGGAECIKKAQFPRVLKEMDIELVLANSPQAKGRVERANQTLQDRLIKEMRIRNISNTEDANEYLEEFIEKFNEKFSKEPRGQFDAHRPLDAGCDLDWVLTSRETRTISKDLSFSFHNKIYQILEYRQCNRLKNKKIDVRRRADGEIKVFYEGKELRFVLSSEWEGKPILDAKAKVAWDVKKKWHPGKDHPWKKYGYQLVLANRLKQMEVAV